MSIPAFRSSKVQNIHGGFKQHTQYFRLFQLSSSGVVSLKVNQLLEISKPEAALDRSKDTPITIA